MPVTGWDKTAVMRRWHLDEKRKLKYARQRQKDVLRPILLRNQPRCDQCGIHLQGIDNTLPNYACVLLDLRLVRCRECVDALYHASHSK